MKFRLGLLSSRGPFLNSGRLLSREKVLLVAKGVNAFDERQLTSRHFTDPDIPILKEAKVEYATLQ